MEQRPLPKHVIEPELAEPRLELIPGLAGAEPEVEPDEPEAEAEERGDEEPEDEGDAGSLDAPAQTQDPLRLYVRQIGDGPLLTREAERVLARRKDQGDEEAKKQLIEANLRLVMTITRH